MGNGSSQCFCGSPSHDHSRPRKLVFWEGTVQSLYGKRRVAGEVMVQFPDQIVCHADSFYIGRPIPALAIGDELLRGETYFVLPIDRFPCGRVLSASSLASFRANPKPQGCPIDFGTSPFKYIRGTRSEEGRLVIKVLPEFITRLILANSSSSSSNGSENAPPGDSQSPTQWSLCSTPELQKHYEQLVGVSKGNEWSPKLATVPEICSNKKNIMHSSCQYRVLEPKKYRHMI